MEAMFLRIKFTLKFVNSCRGCLLVNIPAKLSILMIGSKGDVSFLYRYIRGKKARPRQAAMFLMDQVCLSYFVGQQVTILC